MATKKDFCLSLKDKSNIFVENSINNNQYNNLNLNHQNNHSSNASFLKSKSISTFNKQSFNFNCTNNDLQKNFQMSLWDKQSNKLSSGHNLNADSNEKFRKKHYSNITNSSTLSLHISAYENDTNSTSKSSSDKIMSKKEHLIDSTSVKIQTPFEFPRQQESEATKPEIMQFKASQQLLDPSKNIIGSEKKLEPTAYNMEVFQDQVLKIVESNPVNLIIPLRPYLSQFFAKDKPLPKLFQHRVFQMIKQVNELKDAPFVSKYFEQIIFEILYNANAHLQNQTNDYVHDLSQSIIECQDSAYESLKVISHFHPRNYLISIYQKLLQLNNYESNMSRTFQSILDGMISSKPALVIDWIYTLKLSEFKEKNFNNLLISSLLNGQDLKYLFHRNCYEAQKVLEALDLLCFKESKDFDNIFGEKLTKNGIVKKMFQLASDLSYDPAIWCPHAVRRRRIQNLVYNIRMRPLHEKVEFSMDLMSNIGELEKVEKYDIIGALKNIELRDQYVGVGLGKIFGLEERELNAVKWDYSQRLKWDKDTIESKMKALNSALLPDAYVDKFMIDADRKVLLINSAAKLDTVMAKLNENNLLAFDVEASQVCQEVNSLSKALLLQLAFDDVIYIIDLLVLIQNNADERLKEFFEKLFDPKIIIIGFDVACDLYFLRNTFNWMPSLLQRIQLSFYDIKNFVKLTQTNALYEIFFPKIQKPSLAETVEKWLGIEMCKQLQNCNWKKRPISKSKIEYATNDSMFALKLYHFIEEKKKEALQWFEECLGS